MSSRFFHGASDSESESSSSSDESYVSEEELEQEQVQVQPQKREPGASAFNFAKFLKEEGSDDETAGRRVVKSAKDKMTDDMRTTVKALENAKKINDWVAIQNGEGNCLF